MNIFGIPVILDFTPPLSQAELDQANADLNFLVDHEYSLSEEGIEFQLAMGEAGYVIGVDDDHNVSFVPREE